MQKMEFLKRKHFSLWIILVILTIWNTQYVNGLQGVPTWMCLGIKSPFIEFRSEIELLANTSVAINITKDEQALMHQEGLQKLGSFIKPIDLRNSSTGYVMSNLTKKVPTTPATGRRRGPTENPIAEEMDQKDIELLEEDPNDANQGFPGLTDEDRKFIVPMALKNPTGEPKRATTTITTTTTTTTPAPPLSLISNADTSNNIEDLKNHILMLQNLTKNDKSFQSKFVVFPSLQRERNSSSIFGNSQSNIQSRLQSSFMNTPPPTPITRKPPTFAPLPTLYRPEPTRLKQSFNHDHHDDDDFFMKEKITIIPQVLLLNDQTPPDDDDIDDYEAERRRADEQQRRDRIASRRKNIRRTTTTTTTSTTTTTTTTKKPRRNGLKRRKNGRGNKKRQQNCKNLDTPRCQRQRREQEQLIGLSDNVNKTQSISSISFAQLTESHSPVNLIKNLDENDGNIDPVLNTGNNDEQKLSRSIRSHHKRRNAGLNMKFSAPGSPYYDGGPNRDFIIPVGNGNVGIVSGNGGSSLINNNNQSASTIQPYKEPIDLNPELCYKVDGMTYGQQKLCVLHTSIMPAISRGARAAIQECHHQFKNRRWNCSTTEDNTVFGPMSTIGSPEMAFIHALAAATVTSFIARACRDGQLASCGCSRSSRPRQLHDDWTWGGCGDDLEFAYKFSQDFIDIREKERKRGTRGLVSVPPSSSKHKLDEKLLPTENSNSSSTTAIVNGTAIITSDGNGTKDANNNHENSDNNMNHFKPEVLLELQEKITKEILNSKLQEKEMLELQEKINREIMNSKVFNMDHHHSGIYGGKKHQRNGGIGGPTQFGGRFKNGMSAKARSLMNLHNNEAGRRAVIKKTRITCKCHGVSGSCSMITCWQQLSSIREIGDYLREKFDAATEVKLNKRGRLQIKDPRYKVPTAHDLVYLDESPDWCRNNKQLQWPGTHGRVCNKTSSGLDGCGILCCGRGYNTKNIVVKERCNCKFHWCCQVKCEVCVKVLEEHTCK